MGLFNPASEVSERVLKMESKKINALPTIEKAILAQKIVLAKKRHGKSEYKALNHIFAQLRPNDYMSTIDRLFISRIEALISKDKDLKTATVDENWLKYDLENHTALIHSAAEHLARVCGIIPNIQVYDKPNFSGYGSMDPETGKVIIDTRDDNGYSKMDEVEVPVLTVLHELTHQYQKEKIIPKGKQSIGKKVPSNAQAKLMWANSVCYISPGTWGIRAYKNQPLERHARAFSEKAFSPIKLWIDEGKNKAFDKYKKIMDEIHSQSKN